MYYDSAGNIAEKRNVFAQEGLGGVLALFPQRPLPIATFYLNFLMSDVNPVSYRICNVGLLAGTSLLVVLLVRMILDMPAGSSPRSEGVLTVASIFAGVFFLVHPLQTYLTLYIWQRMGLMACFFSYACVAAYLAVRTGRWQKPWAGYTLCVVLFVAAVLSKENSITVPAILVLAEMAFFRESWPTLAKRASMYGLVTVVVLVSISMLQHPHGNAQLGTGIRSTMSQYYAESGLTVWQVLCTQSRVIFSYLSLILFPVPSRAQLINPQVLSLSLTDPPSTALAVPCVLVLACTGLYLLKKMPVWGFGILFFLINFLPEGLLVPQYAFFGYRPVLPMLGVLLILADCLTRFLEAVGDSQPWRLLRACMVALLAGWIILLATSTALRADLWSDPIRFWKETVDAFPSDRENMERKVASHALGNEGAALFQAERYAEAADYYERAIALSPEDPRKLISLAAVYAELGNLNDAEKLLRKAIAIAPDFVSAYRNLGIVLMKGDKLDQALDTLHQGLEHAAGDDSLYQVMGQAQLMKKDVPAAVASFGRAIATNPGSAALHFQLGQAFLAQGNSVAAKESFLRALELKPDYWEVCNTLGILYAREGHDREALAQFQKALSINPENLQLRANVEQALKRVQDPSHSSRPVR